MGLPFGPNVASVSAAVLPTVDPRLWQSELNSVLPGAIAPAARAAGLAAGALLASGLGTALKAGDLFVDFETSLTRITTLVGIAEEEVAGFGEAILDLAPDVGRAPQELADALFFVTSAGLRGDAALSALEASAKAAALGLGETQTVADAATSALNAYGSAGLTAEDAVGVLVKSVEQGKLEADALAESIGQVIPLASEAGVSFNEVGAALAAVSRTGLDASEGATALRAILSTVAKPTTQAEEALSQYGLTTQNLRDVLAEDGLLALLDLLRTSVGDNTEALTAIIPNVRALTGFLSLTGSQAESTRQIFAELTDVTGILDERFEQLQDTQAFRRQQAEAERLAVLTGEGSEAAESLTQILEEIPGVLEAIIPPLVDIGEGLLAFGSDVAAGVGVLADGIGNLGGEAVGTSEAVTAVGVAIGVLTGNPVIAAIALVAGAVAGIGEKAQLSEQRVEILADSLEGLVAGSDAFGDSFEDAIGRIVDASGEGGFFGRLFQGFGDVQNNLDDAGIGVDQLAEAVERLADTGADSFTAFEVSAALDLEPGRLVDPELTAFIRTLVDEYREYQLVTGQAADEQERLANEARQSIDDQIQAAAAAARARGEYERIDGIDLSLDLPTTNIAEFAQEVGGLTESLLEAKAAGEDLNDEFKEQADPVFGAVSALSDYQDLLSDIDSDGQRTAQEVLELAKAGLEVESAFARVDDNGTAAIQAFIASVENIGGDPIAALEELGITVDEVTGEIITDLEGVGQIDGQGIGDDFLAASEQALAVFNAQFGGLATPIANQNGQIIGAQLADGTIIELSNFGQEVDRVVGEQLGEVDADTESRLIALGIGEGIRGGILEGLGNLSGALQAKIIGEISAAKSQVERTFAISSPSRVFAEDIGAPLAEGIIAGFSEALAQGLDASVASAAGQFDTAALGGTTVVINNPTTRDIVDEANVVTSVVSANSYLGRIR